MGRRGLSDFMRVVYGSVSSYVLSHAPCMYEMDSMLYFLECVL